MRFQTSISPLLKWVAVSKLPKLSAVALFQDSHPRGHIPNCFSLTTPLPSSAQRSAEKPSCQGVRCAPSQLCQVVDGQARCVPGSWATCRAHSDPHYTTFDGRRYDMMGTCSYMMAELNSEDQTLPAFSVEAKNEHRGSRRVSYVGFVTVRAYSHSVSLARGEVGFARVSIQSLQSLMPIS